MKLWTTYGFRSSALTLLLLLGCCISRSIACPHEKRSCDDASYGASNTKWKQGQCRTMELSFSMEESHDEEHRTGRCFCAFLLHPPIAFSHVLDIPDIHLHLLGILILPTPRVLSIPVKPIPPPPLQHRIRAWQLESCIVNDITNDCMFHFS